MPLYAETFEQVADRFKEWLVDRDLEGDYVENIALDYINRANQNLWGRAFWDDLMVHAALTLSNKQATFPADYGRTYCVYHDQDSDGKPDFFYCKDGRYGQGYRLTRTYSPAAGSSFTAKFFATPSYTPYLLYQKRLDDFTGTGTEYIFWPAELLLKEAQCVCKEDDDDLDASYDKLSLRRNQLLEDLKTYHQFANTDFRMEQNDAAGTPVSNEDFNLADGGSGEPNLYDNSRDDGLI